MIFPVLRCRAPILTGSTTWGVMRASSRWPRTTTRARSRWLSIRGWWRAEGHHLYLRPRRLLITADGGGSNGWRLRLWKWELQRLADQTGLTLAVCHFHRARANGTRWKT